MKRVMIVGGPGSGKSTLARWIGTQLDLPVFHMDLIHWHKNWIERPKSEKILMAQAVEAKPEWVFEGGMSATYDSRVSRADTLIWLDLPVGLRLWRVTKRLFRYLDQNRPDLPEGCVERLHPGTLEFYRFIWTSRHSARARIEKLVAGSREGMTVVHLRSTAEVTAFRKQLACTDTP